MEPDFFRRAMPHFYDKEGAEIKDVGLVQTPWSFSNIHDNLLVESGESLHYVIPVVSVLSKLVMSLTV